MLLEIKRMVLWVFKDVFLLENKQLSQQMYIVAQMRNVWCIYGSNILKFLFKEAVSLIKFSNNGTEKKADIIRLFGEIIVGDFKEQLRI